MNLIKDLTATTYERNEANRKLKLAIEALEFYAKWGVESPENDDKIIDDCGMRARAVIAELNPPTEEEQYKNEWNCIHCGGETVGDGDGFRWCQLCSCRFDPTTQEEAYNDKDWSCSYCGGESIHMNTNWCMCRYLTHEPVPSREKEETP